MKDVRESKKLKMVIADDHPVFLIGLKTFIESNFSKNFTICGETTNVDDLLDVLESENPDVLLTDFSMPGGKNADGLRLLSGLCRKYPHLDIIVVTVLSNEGLIQSIMKLGVFDVVNKISLTSDLEYCLEQVQHTRAGTQQSSKYANHRELEMVHISPRELEVLRLLSHGLTVNEIAKKLNRTKQTISAQKKNAMNKLGLTSMQELFEYLILKGI